METLQTDNAPLVVLPNGKLGYKTTSTEYPDYLFYSDGRVFNRHKKRFLKTQSKKLTAYPKLRLVGADGVNKTHSLHVIIAFVFLGPMPASAELVDHKDRNRHNATITNLRYVKRAHNSYNRVSCKNSSSKYLGVVLRPNGRYEASIKVNGCYEYLGKFTTEEEAATAYQKAKTRLHIIPALLKIPIVHA